MAVIAFQEVFWVEILNYHLAPAAGLSDIRAAPFWRADFQPFR